MSNPLTDVLPPRFRRYYYAALFLLALGFAAYQATDGDWWEFGAYIVAALGGGVAAANTPAPEPRTYDEHGRTASDLVLPVLIVLTVVLVAALLL